MRHQAGVPGAAGDEQRPRRDGSLDHAHAAGHLHRPGGLRQHLSGAHDHQAAAGGHQHDDLEVGGAQHTDQALEHGEFDVAAPLVGGISKIPRLVVIVKDSKVATD